jgi:hypothetical protein
MGSNGPALLKIKDDISINPVCLRESNAVTRLVGIILVIPVPDALNKYLAIENCMCGAEDEPGRNPRFPGSGIIIK